MTPRSHKQNGTEAETKAGDYLRPWWPNVKRLAPAGAADLGDLEGIPDTCVQVKNHKRMTLAAWVDQAAIQASRAGKRYHVVIHKRVRKGSPADWYVTMPLSVFVQGWKPPASG